MFKNLIFFASKMAPTGQETIQISNIDDLDSANTSGKALKRNKSINNTAVLVAKCVAEHDDDLNPRETTTIGDKLHSETEVVLEDGSLDELCLPVNDISCLCGVDVSVTTPKLDFAGALSSLDQSFLTKSPPRTWRSSGKGKKRKKTKAGYKKKIHKRQKTDVSMVSASECMKNFVSKKDSFTDNEVSFEFGGAKTVTCKKTAGDGKQKAGTKGGCVATQQTPGPVTGNSKACCSRVRAHRGGGGDDGDDGEGKPPRKPPENVPCSKMGKQKPKKKKKASSEMEVDTEDGNNVSIPVTVSSSGMDVSLESTSEVTRDQEVVPDQCQQQENIPHVQPEQPRQEFVPTQGILMVLHGCINHFNFCTTRPCVRCHRVETTLIQHHFEATNGTCRCPKCKLWLCVLEYHTGICKLKYCIVCERVQRTPRPAPAAPVIVHQTPSLDPDDLIVWKDESFPNVTHFKEDEHYMLLNDSFIDKGGHGAVHNVAITDNVKKKYFNSDSVDFVMKKTDKVEEDEKYVFEQTSKHPNFVQTYLVVKRMHPNMHHRILMEKCEKSLKDHLKELVNKGEQMKIYEAMFYWTQTFDALKHLHHLRIPVIHKDVKAENVLLTVKDNLVRVKLADYDTVKKLHHEFTRPGLCPKGTPGFISPEVLRQGSHGRPADVWNMAMFLLQMLFVVDFTLLQVKILGLKNQKNCNRFMFVHETEKLIQEFLNQKIPQLKQMDSNLANLIESCLDEDPSKRPTAIEVLQHPAVTEYTKREINMDELIRQICPNLKAS